MNHRVAHTDLACYDSGSGRPVVLLHSFGHNKTMWSPQLTFLRERGFRVIAPDMPGHGESPFDPDHHSVDRIARTYHDLLDAKDVRGAVVCGISMGGYVALRMWAQRHDRIAGLVLSNTKAEADSDEIRARRRGQIASIREHGLAAFIESGAPRRLSARTLAERPWVLDAVRMMNFTVSAEANCATLEAMARKEDDTPVLPTIDVPTLLTTGSDDAFIPKSAAAVLAAGIPAARSHVIVGTGHVSSLEDPTEYNQVLDAFLAELR